jgi:hypothetical protein
MTKVAGALVTALGVVASLIAVVAARDAIWAWLYPVPLIAVLTTALGATWIYVGLERRKPSDADQRRLDRLLGALPREAVRRLEGEDFAAPWRERSVYPFTYYLHELDGPEEQFSAKAMERHRNRLYVAVDKFLWAEAKKGFAHEQARGFRNTGWSLGELEGDDDKLALAEERSREIRSAAAAVISAHRALLKLASSRGYSLAAIASPLPVASWDTPEQIESL